MKNLSRKIDTNSKTYEYMLWNSSKFYAKFFGLTARNDLKNNFISVIFKTVS